jgi:predicted  nucleic acid-binding Zn-ribbon protein
MDNKDRNAVSERLAAIDGRIKEFRAKLEHHGLYDESHRMTEKELRDRMSTIENEVASRSVSHQQASENADWLERTLEKWVVATDFDYTSGERSADRS